MNILEEALRTGVLVEPEAVKKLFSMPESQKPALLEKIKNDKPLIISTKYLDEFFQQKQKYSVQDFVAALNEYFEEAKKLFPGLNPVSIRNCSESATIIGIVKKITEEASTIKIELEDPTGSIDVVCNKGIDKGIKEDDVIAAAGYVKNGLLKAEKIFQAPAQELEQIKEKFPLLFKIYSVQSKTV